MGRDPNPLEIEALLSISLLGFHLFLLYNLPFGSFLFQFLPFSVVLIYEFECIYMDSRFDY